MERNLLTIVNVRKRFKLDDLSAMFNRLFLVVLKRIQTKSSKKFAKSNIGILKQILQLNHKIVAIRLYNQ